MQETHADGGEAHAEVSLQVHHQRRVVQVIEMLKLTDHPAQLVARHQELPREGICEALANAVRTWHRDDDIGRLGVEEGMGELMGQGEHLSAQSHLGVDGDAEAGLGMVVEESRRRLGEIQAERQTPDQNVLVQNLERVAQRATT